ncbi:Hypothetical predicted protein [Cloeon dipterum]|uniref:SAP domain-containing protein n=1 Tax=Cloeon dipterum TaxID=197152 RepID=A0A8S1DRQ6_9INSE|nr:Hypothetical predicted protein [Cloeon dipterum]
MDVSKLKVAEIKKELKDRGLNTVGNKQELLTRLQEALDAEEIGQVDEDEHLNGAEEAVVDEVEDVKEEDATAVKEEKQTKKIVLKRQVEFPEEVVVARAAAPKQEITGPVAGAIASSAKNSLTPEERMALRAKRFGPTETTPAAAAAPTPAAAAPKTDAAEPPAKIAKVELSDEQKERLRKRAERFGTSVSPLIEVVDAEEKRRQRQERFSTASDPSDAAPADAIGVAPVVEPATLKVLSLEERKKLRADRFNKTTAFLEIRRDNDGERLASNMADHLNSSCWQQLNQLAAQPMLDHCLCLCVYKLALHILLYLKDQDGHPEILQHQVPEFDNIYLDMNGIIHNCSHPNDNHNHRITQTEIFKGIFAYIERLIGMVRPRQLIFFAVDGVAPRAKMNQQRARRFRAAKDAASQAEREKKNNEKIEGSGDRFDSNCITPGTEFMVRLQAQLEYFVQLKMSTDPIWQRPRIVLSGHEVPGEGEHKIMDYIRYLKVQPEYNPTTRHCLYGLDADLMMLGLCTHEPNFSLLREEVKFSSQAQKTIASPAEIRFFLLHLSLFREYLDLEFSMLKHSLSFGYDLERIIDDWIIICYLVGNDFLPHLPSLHIAAGALPLMYRLYMRVLPTLDGYINEAGTINMDRFIAFMDELGQYDFEEFANMNPDVEMPEEKYSKKKTDDLASLLASTDFANEVEEEDEACQVFSKHPTRELSKDTLHLEFYQHKRHYYTEKLNYAKVTEEKLQDLAEEYLRGVQWVAHYYYDGVASWAWYYPHHYAPYASDVAAFAIRPSKGYHFNKGTPFLPFQQLLGVLPAASRVLLPRAYHPLMLMQTSPLKHFYPEDFDTDLNGKKQDWEAVVLIPFIDEKLLLDAMATVEHHLTPEEVARNRHSIAIEYTYSRHSIGPVKATEYFPKVARNHAIAQPVPDLNIAPHLLVKGPCPRIDRSLFVPGFPTFRHIEFTTRLESIGVKVFDSPAQKDRPTMVLRLKAIALKSAADFQHLLGTSVWVHYPHLQEAIVEAVVDRAQTLTLSKANGNREIIEASTEETQFVRASKDILERYYGRLGIVVGEINVVLKVRMLEGRTFSYSVHGKVTVEKKWAAVEESFAAQTVVPTLKALAPQISQFDTIHDVFKVDSLCFLTHAQNYGYPAKVLPPNKPNRVNVEVQIPQDPPLDKMLSTMEANSMAYLPCIKVCRFVGLPAATVSKVTGVLLMANPKEPRNRINIGLGLKMHMQNKAVPGYAKRDNNEWSYSQKAVDLLREYIRRFPEVFSFLQCSRDRPQNRNEYIKSTDIFTLNCDERLEELKKWLSEQAGSRMDARKCDSLALDPLDVLALEKMIDQWSARKADACTRKLELDPQFLFKPVMDFGPVIVDPTVEFFLLDRVVCVREDFSVPLGLMGTVIGIDTEEGSKLKVQVLFDKEFAQGQASWGCEQRRCFCLSKPDVINLSHGRRKLLAKPAAPSPTANAWTQRESMRSAFATVQKNGRKSGTPTPKPPSPQSLPLPNDSDVKIRAFFTRALTPS